MMLKGLCVFCVVLKNVHVRIDDSSTANQIYLQVQIKYPEPESKRNWACAFSFMPKIL